MQGKAAAQKAKTDSPQRAQRVQSGKQVFSYFQVCVCSVPSVFSVVNFSAWPYWCFVLLALAGCAPKTETTTTKAEKGPVVITTEPVTPRPVRRAVNVVGSLAGREEVTLTPKVDGRVVAVRHDLGDTVKAGEVLLEIDPTDYDLATIEARRALELELAKLGLTEMPSAAFELAKLPSVTRATAQEQNARLKLERWQKLGTGGVAAAEDLDKARAEFAVAVAESRQSLLDAQATIAAARQKQASLATAEQRLKDTKIIAPGEPGKVEYAVGLRGVAPGEMVRAGMGGPLFKLAVVQPLKLILNVPERHAREVRIGQTVELEVESDPGTKYPATVERVSPTVEPASRTFRVEATVPNAERRLRPGSFARASIATGTDPAARTVPEEAVVNFAGVTKVFAVKDGSVRAIPVKTGVSLEVAGANGAVRTWLEVVGDLKPGEAVATSGQTQLADGTAVRER